MNPILYIRSAFEVYNERQKVRKLRVFLSVGILLIAWGAVVIIVLKTPKMEQHVHVSAPAVIPSSNHAPSGVSGIVVPTMRPTSLTRRQITIQTPQPSSYSTHQGTGSSSLTIHTTSSAAPVFVGGGGSGGYTGSNYNHSNPTRAIAQNTVSTSMMIITPVQRLEKHNLSADNTLQNMQQVIEDNGPNAVAARMKKDGWDDYGQDDEPFLDQQPIGDVTWGLMLLLTIGWCVRVHRKRQQACK